MNRKKYIRFDWIIKKLLRNNANFSILEGFLSEHIKKGGAPRQSPNRTDHTQYSPVSNR